jgi:RNA polymerase II elongation factor ELL
VELLHSLSFAHQQELSLFSPPLPSTEFGASERTVFFSIMAASFATDDELVLLRTPDCGPASTPALPPQVIRLSMTQKATEDILKSFQGREKTSIRFGKRVTVQHGKKAYSVFACPETNPSELYQRSINDENTFHFSGKFTHRLETQMAQTDTSKTDEALANLENSLKSYEEQKASNEARFVTDKDELRHLTEASQRGKANLPPRSAIRKDRLLSTTSHSNPSSPFLGPARSPAIGPTSASRSVPTSLGKGQVRLNAIKIPLLHLLAVAPLTTQALAQTTHATKEDCEKLLHKYGKDVREATGKQELKDKAYRELDLWKFPYPNDNDRQAAIGRTISAFDRMRISTTDPIWETLLLATERGKGRGSELSRLKIGQAGLNGLTPKLGLSKGDPHAVADAGPDHGKAAFKAKGTARTKGRSGTDEDHEENSTVRREAAKKSKEVHGKGTAKKEKKRVQPGGKFKSAEVIEDSDEELGGTEEIVPDTAKPSKATYAMVRSSTANQPSKLATTSPLRKEPTSSSKPQPRAAANLMSNWASTRPRSESATEKASPRPRTDSSPKKPSPLASSPPTNATDLDNSQSSKASSLSSATSSPAISLQHDRNQKAKTSPVAKHRSGTLKRKATDQPSPAPKRQQLQEPNGTHIARPATNGINKSHHKTPANSQRSRGPSSSSTSTSSPARAKPPTNLLPQADLQLRSRRFKIQYAQYHALHAKMMALPEEDRDAEEVRVLRKMHSRIGELKREIWERWEMGRGRDQEREKWGKGR